MNEKNYTTLYCNDKFWSSLTGIVPEKQNPELFSAEKKPFPFVKTLPGFLIF